MYTFCSGPPRGGPVHPRHQAFARASAVHVSSRRRHLLHAPVQAFPPSIL
jgi:hypothetical protein